MSKNHTVRLTVHRVVFFPLIGSDGIGLINIEDYYT